MSFKAIKETSQNYEKVASYEVIQNPYFDRANAKSHE
jgi:hypothetical protein